MLARRATLKAFSCRLRGTVLRKMSSAALTPEDMNLVDNLVHRAVSAQKIFSTYSQEQVDKIINSAALAAVAARIDLANQAVEETKRGVMEDKVTKNHFAAENVVNYLRGKDTCSSKDDSFGVYESPEPFGTFAVLTPVTNPTSTVIYKALMLLKTRNSAVFCFHPGATKCSAAAAELLHQAAVQAGAPEGILSWSDKPLSRAAVNAIMNHPEISFIWATGGADMVKAAQAANKPALLAGPGNCPALIDETADISQAISDILLSKAFDNGMICAAEQSMVVVDQIYDIVIQELTLRGAKVLNSQEANLLREAMRGKNNKDSQTCTHINKELVGMTPQQIGQIAGIHVDPSVRALVAEANSIEPTEEPMTWEKMSPILGLFRARDFDDAIRISKALVSFSGRGHVGVIHTKYPSDHARIQKFRAEVPVGLLLLNQPSSMGTIGDIYNFKAIPRLSVPTGSGCTAVQVEQLQRHRPVMDRTPHCRWLHLPPRIFFEANSTPFAISKLASASFQRNPGVWNVVLMSDQNLFNAGYVRSLIGLLEANSSSKIKVVVKSFVEIEPDPGFSTILKGIELLRSFQPDTIVAFGGGSVMDAAKVMRLLLDHPEVNNMDGLKLRFMDITKRVFSLPASRDHLMQKLLGDSHIQVQEVVDRKLDNVWVRDVDLVCIPTTSGTGSEVTPFAVVTDPRDGVKYPLCDYAMTPQMAIVDSKFAMTIPHSLIAAPGYDAIVHALESYTSTMSSEFTRPFSSRALKLLVGENNLLNSFKHGDSQARDAVHTAATLAGCAIGNAFVGIAHSIAHQLGAKFHISHGVACAISIIPVIRFNASKAPLKQTVFPQYTTPIAMQQYAEIAKLLGLKTSTSDEHAVEWLINVLVKLRDELELPRNLRECGVSKESFYRELDSLALQAFDDQCTVSNPRYPLVCELRSLIEECF